MAGSLHCPRDGSTAVLKKDEGPRGSFVIDVCPTCGGAWFDRGEVSKVAGDREIERKIVEYAGGASDLRCPRCERQMVRRPVGDVTLDVCPQCKGVWFDAGELAIAERSLAAEFSAFEPSPATDGISRAWLVGSRFFMSRAALRQFLNPPIRRTYPPD